MNKVDIYVNGFRLDVFNDEQISINLSVQNVQDISKIFTDFHAELHRTRHGSQQANLCTILTPRLRMQQSPSHHLR
jgi:hypothetical protein